MTNEVPSAGQLASVAAFNWSIKLILPQLNHSTVWHHQSETKNKASLESSNDGGAITANNLNKTYIFFFVVITVLTKQAKTNTKDQNKNIPWRPFFFSNFEKWELRIKTKR